ncbi:MAG: TolC family protein [Alphaproteobacteria bacterium]|nr:TolC family protein [Alphaproteobacteria bacterium]MBN2675511.1 TolC family protein [Alphaproteobacteria bacterium]
MRNFRLVSIISIIFSAAFMQNSFAMDLSFESAVEKIMTESQDLKKSDANIKKAQAQLDAVNANRWFNIEGTASYMNMVNVERPLSGEGVVLPPEFLVYTGGFQIPDNTFMAGATVKQPIYTFGKIGNAVDAVRSAIKISESGKELAQREVRYAAANMYWTAKMTDGLVNIAEKSLKDTVSAKNKLTAAGRVGRGNLVKIESDIESKKINLSDAKFNRDTAYRMLKILADIDMDEDLNLTDEIPSDFVDIDIKDLKSNPEWDMLNQQAQMYESNASSKRAGHYPTLAATGSYSYIATNTESNVFGGHKDQIAYLGLALQVPIFDGGLARANATIEAMNAETVRQDLDKSKKIKTEQYDTAIKKYKHLRGNLKSLENAKNLAEKAYNISCDRFAAGQTSAVELAEVSAALSQLDMALLNAKYNILMSAESIKKLGE